MDLKDVECFKCHKKGHYANKCPDAKSKVDRKGFLKVWHLEEPANDKKDDKAIRQLRIRTLIAAILTIAFDIGSSCTIWLGRFGTSYTLVTWPMCS